MRTCKESFRSCLDPALENQTMKVKVDMEVFARTQQMDPKVLSGDSLKHCRGAIDAINANLITCDNLTSEGFLQVAECAGLKNVLSRQLSAVKTKYGIQDLKVDVQPPDVNPDVALALKTSARFLQPPKPVDTFSDDPFAALHVLQEVSTNATLKSLHGLRSPKISSPHARVIFAEDQDKKVTKKRGRSSGKTEPKEAIKRSKRRGSKIPAYAEDCAGILESEKKVKLSKDGTNRRGRQSRTTHSLKSKLAVIAVYDDTVKARGGKDRGVKRFVANILNLSETMIGRWINERDRIKTAFEKSVARGRNHKNCVTKQRKEPVDRKGSKARSTSSKLASEAI